MSLLRVDYLRVWGARQMERGTSNMWSSVTVFLKASQVGHFIGVYRVNSEKKDLNLKGVPGKRVLKLVLIKVFMIILLLALEPQFCLYSL